MQRVLRDGVCNDFRRHLDIVSGAGCVLGMRQSFTVTSLDTTWALPAHVRNAPAEQPLAGCTGEMGAAEAWAGVWARRHPGATPRVRGLKLETAKPRVLELILRGDPELRGLHEHRPQEVGKGHGLLKANSVAALHDLGDVLRLPLRRAPEVPAFPEEEP